MNIEGNEDIYKPQNNQDGSTITSDKREADAIIVKNSRILVDYRDSSSSSASTGGEDSTEEEEPEFQTPIIPSTAENATETEDDSDVEFNRILEVCRKHHHMLKESELGEEQERNVERRNRRLNREKYFDSEYYSLPPIEKLNIDVNENERLEKFGIVDSHIDFIVKVKPFDGVPHLGYDTILFGSDRNPMGEIFEIFGTVTETLYALRFNSKAEAEEKMPIGKEVYYIATNESVTKKVFPQELAKLKNWERLRTNAAAEGSSSSEEAFSDDQEEQRYLAKKRQKTRHRQNNESNGSSISRDSPSPRKKKRRSTPKHSRSNPFHPQHNQWRQQRQHFSSPAGYYQAPQPQFMPPHPYYPQYPPYQTSPAQWAAYYYPPPPPSPMQFAFQHQPPYGPYPATSHYQQIPTSSTPHQFFNNQNYVPQKACRQPPPPPN